jgi:hypothetical protein
MKKSHKKKKWTNFRKPSVDGHFKRIIGHRDEEKAPNSLLISAKIQGIKNGRSGKWSAALHWHQEYNK